MYRVALIVVITAASSSIGCDQLLQQQKPAAPVAKSKETRVAAHGFVLTKVDGGVAFDTQTGQICRTWDWQPIGKSAQIDPSTGNTPQRAFGEFAPTCISLYAKYPSGTESGPEVISEGSESN